MNVTPDKLASRIIAIATDFVGLVETAENSHWDDPSTPFADSAKDAWLRKWMAKVSGWTPGAPYCVAFDGACVANALQQCGLNAERFLANWTAHVMTNANRMREMKLLSKLPLPGAIWLARHGFTDAGHAGVVIACNGSYQTTVEGNTSAGPTADAEKQRQGDGIWQRMFEISGRGDLRTQGFVLPEAILKLAA